MDYIDNGDIEIINFALESGSDVRIQRTPRGVRILRDTVKVMKRKDMPDEDDLYGAFR